MDAASEQPRRRRTLRRRQAVKNTRGVERLPFLFARQVKFPRRKLDVLVNFQLKFRLSTFTCLSSFVIKFRPRGSSQVSIQLSSQDSLQLSSSKIARFGAEQKCARESQNRNGSRFESSAISLLLAAGRTPLGRKSTTFELSMTEPTHQSLLLSHIVTLT